MEKLIKCPCCLSVLEITHQDRYQDLCEHVSNPNGLPSLKDAYQCPDTECIANKCDVVWIEDGDYFLGKRPENIKRTELINSLEKRYGIAYAVDSWNFHYNLGKEAIKKKTRELNLYWYRFVFSPKEKGWKYEIEERHQPNLWKWKIEFWKKGSEPGCWTYVIPFWKMVSYNMRQFKNAYKNWKETESKTSLKAAYCTTHSLEEWGMNKDKRFYSRLSALLIQFLYPNRVKELNNAIKLK